MRKSTILISTALTTFALFMLYNVVSAYRNNQNIAQITAEPLATLAPEPTDESAPIEVALSPEEAAQRAIQVVGNSNLLSAESANVNGVNAYKIIFTNNDVVYVGLDGQILSVQVAPVVVNVPSPVRQKNKNNSGAHIKTGSGEDQTSHEENHEEHD